MRRFDILPSEIGLLQRHRLDTLEAVFACRRGERLDKAGLERWRQRWRLRLDESAGEPKVYYLKRFVHPPLRRQIERWREGRWFQGTAGVEWSNARALAEAGIPAARAVACGQEMAGIWERRSCILLAEVPGESLEKWVPRHLPPRSRENHPAIRQQRLDRLARLVGAFHGAGFIHRDLYLSHIFIDKAVPAEGGLGGKATTAQRHRSDGTATSGPLFCLIDLQRVFRPRWRHRRWAVKDLAALHFSTPEDRVDGWERLRFLCRYTRICRRFGSARTLAGRIAAKSERMRQREQKRLMRRQVVTA